MEIKIIDLLNRIYNKDNIPQRIIYNNRTWKYSDIYNDFKDENNNYLFGNIMARYSDTCDFLKSEVEIIEEDKNIEKLDNRNYDEINKIYCGKKALGEAEIVDKINEIIDVVNKLKGRIK